MELLSIFFTISLAVSKLKILGKTCTKETDKQIALPSRHFMVCTHIDHVALDQSARDKSLSYGKTFFRTKKIKCCDCQATYIGETGRNLSTQLTVHQRAKRNGDVNDHIAKHQLQTTDQIHWHSVTCRHYVLYKPTSTIHFRKFVN